MNPYDINCCGDVKTQMHNMIPCNLKLPSLLSHTFVRLFVCLYGAKAPLSAKVILRQGHGLGSRSTDEESQGSNMRLLI